MEAKEITIEEKIIEKAAMNRLLDYVLETMDAMGRQENEEAQVQN